LPKCHHPPSPNVKKVIFGPCSTITDWPCFPSSRLAPTTQPHPSPSDPRGNKDHDPSPLRWQPSPDLAAISITDLGRGVRPLRRRREGRREGGRDVVCGDLLRGRFDRPLGTCILWNVKSWAPCCIRGDYLHRTFEPCLSMLAYPHFPTDISPSPWPRDSVLWGGSLQQGHVEDLMT
jgi:hypothetical protein